MLFWCPISPSGTNNIVLYLKHPHCRVAHATGSLLSVVNRPASFWGFVLFEHESTLEGGLSFEASEQIEKKQNNTLRFELLTSTFWRGENETAAWWERWEWCRVKRVMSYWFFPASVSPADLSFHLTVSRLSASSRKPRHRLPHRALALHQVVFYIGGLQSCLFFLILAGNEAIAVPPVRSVN